MFLIRRRVSADDAVSPGVCLRTEDTAVFCEFEAARFLDCSDKLWQMDFSGCV